MSHSPIILYFLDLTPVCAKILVMAVERGIRTGQLIPGMRPGKTKRSCFTAPEDELAQMGEQVGGLPSLVEHGSGIIRATKERYRQIEANAKGRQNGS